VEGEKFCPARCRLDTAGLEIRSSREWRTICAAPIHDVYCGRRGFTRELYDSLASNDHEASFILTLFGVPMRTCGGKWKIEQRLAINDSSRVNIDALVAELKEESRELAN